MRSYAHTSSVVAVRYPAAWAGAGDEFEASVQHGSCAAWPCMQLRQQLIQHGYRALTGNAAAPALRVSPSGCVTSIQLPTRTLPCHGNGNDRALSYAFIMCIKMCCSRPGLSCHAVSCQGPTYMSQLGTHYHAHATCKLVADKLY